jgi:hypothetical protein
MKLKLVLTTAIVGVALASPASGGGAVAFGQQAPPGQQSAVSSNFFIVERALGGSFNAVSDPGGANPSGQVQYHEGGGQGPTVQASVTCLSVSGNTAVIGFQGTRFFPPFPPAPVSGELVVTDNGPEGFPSLDTAALSERVPSTSPPNCSAPGPVDGPFRVWGDILVTAALPASKEQCKNGGWEQFDFTNQGQCIAFVNRGP